MAEEIMVEGLSGVDIIEDFLDQIRRKLMKSCDLRDNDCWSEGYSATVDIHMKLYDSGETPLDMKFELPAKVEPPVSTETTVVTPVEIVEKVEIPQELNVEEVRARSKQDIPPPPEPFEVEGNGIPQRLKRKYTRRTPLENVPQAEGGSVEIEPQF